MDQNNPLQNNFSNTGFNNYSQSPTNVIPMDYSSYLLTTDDNVISESYAARNCEQQSEQSAFSFVNNEDSTSTAHAPQYSNQDTSSLNTNSSRANNSESFQFETPGLKIIVVPTSSPFANLNNFDTMQNQFQQDYIYSNSSLNQEQKYVFEIPGHKIIVLPTSSPFANLTNFDTMQNQSQQDYTYSSPSLNQEQNYVFEISGFKIIVVPTSSPFANLTNLDTMQNQFQQDYTYSNPSLYTSMVGPSQLNQEQSYVSSKSSVSGSSGGSSVNIHHQQ
jgi:Fe-S cluster assembly iron-binding protein IscA